MKDSELLRKAREVVSIKSNYRSGICSAISIAAGTWKTPQVKSLKDWIQEMLGKDAFLNLWLERNGYITESDYDDSWDYTLETWLKIQATRLAWLDWMIEQCEIAEAKETK